MATDRTVAIVGVGGEFPDSPTLERFWETIISNTDTSREPPPGRWMLDVDDVYSTEKGAPDQVYSRKVCFLDDEDLASDDYGELDPDFVETLDPSFRLLLRVGRQTLNDGPDTQFERSRAGVIVGNLALPSEKSSQLSRYLLGQAYSHQNKSGLSVPEKTVDPINRYVAGLPASLLARAVGFGGSCYTVDAACASSLYAIKLAADELTSGRADAMLAGGLSRPDSLYTQMGFSQLQALSPTGTCSPFSLQGNGLVVGEGCGLVLLKRTEDAVRDGDTILAVIRGIGLSNDLQGNLLAPASEGQLRAMQSAYKQAGWQPDDVDLIECHATGTPVGDKVEFSSLVSLWKNLPWQPGQCVIGSVKANIGHLLTAAGSAALIKTLLAMKHQILPPMTNYTEPGTGIDIENSPFRVLKSPQRWETEAGKPRRAAVSAFGFGGINAHLLIEEWRPKMQSKVSSVRSHPHFHQRSEAIAIVGMASHFGSWTDLDSFRRRLFSSSSEEKPEMLHRWWGIEKSDWYRDQGFSDHSFPGFFIPNVSARAGEFKIPPKELEEMLPRQLLMLKVAAAALSDAGIEQDDHLFTGVFVGCGLDLNATSFSFRWRMHQYACQWAEELGLKLDRQELLEWVRKLREGCGPALSANRTMGALGSVVASRIAKNFRIGGPSFTLSNEENSGLKALDVAVQSLQQGEINRALVGAVDLTGDMRNALSRATEYPYSSSGEAKPFDVSADGTLIGEGAAAVVLKRLADAKQDGDRVYAVIRGVGSAVGGAVSDTRVWSDTYRTSLERTCVQADCDGGNVTYIETDGSGDAEMDRLEASQLDAFIAQNKRRKPCHIGSVKADIGHAGAAAGMASLVKTALCLNHRILPPLRGGHLNTEGWGDGRDDIIAPTEAQYWLHNAADGSRQALVCGLGTDGSCSHALLEEFSEGGEAADSLPRPFQIPEEGLFIVGGEQTQDVLNRISQLEQLKETHAELSIAQLAALWYQVHPRAVGGMAVSFIADSTTVLSTQIETARRSISDDPQRPIGFAGGDPFIDPALKDRVFFSPQPLGREGKTAFIFPGSGNHFAAMGRRLSAFWPHVYRRQEQGSRFLADQYQPEHFWRQELSDAIHQDHNALVISHVAHCTAIHDLVRTFAINPHMISGYSLGESSALFSSGAWSDRDGMLQRLKESSLFVNDLAGECRAARRVWGLPPTDEVDWQLGIVDVSADKVREAISGRKHVYLLIVNSYREAVVGGQDRAVEQLVADLGCHFIPLTGVTTVHCEVTKAVASAYRELHLFDVNAPKGIDFYSCALGRKYPLTRENAADVILAQALETIDYPQVIEQLYADGARIFIESGPGNSCTRMINSILEDRPHLARSISISGQDPVSQLLRLLGSCASEGLEVDLAPLYPPTQASISDERSSVTILATVNREFFCPPTPEKDVHTSVFSNSNAGSAGQSKTFESKSSDALDESVIQIAEQTIASQNAAHQAYLDFSNTMQQTLTATINHQMAFLQQLAPHGLDSVLESEVRDTADEFSEPVPEQSESVLFDRDMCMEFAIGSVGRMLGPEFAEVDSYPTRVRLPDEPLMLVDRILQLEGEPRSMTSGRVVTEHDVYPGRWYLDGGRIPTCIAVEAGQADLFLSGYLGIDFIGKGRAVYRLLDAVVTFHRTLPVCGETIHYDIRIDEFFRQGDTYLFRFNFEGTVDGQPLLSMRNGCAGFFSAEELAAGQGIVHTKLDLMPQPGVLPDDWRELVPMARESYDDNQIDALYYGDIGRCFGGAFANLPLKRPYTLPGGRLKLVDRVFDLDPEGGRYGIGQITAEMDINADDWFLTCHFVDDRVMPGTLMYECCLHTLRIYLLRMGWIGEEEQTWCEPVPGVASGLKCRGQVIETTRTVTYQVSIKELGYRPEPFAIVDALMYADGHAIVEIPDMSVRLAGLDRQKVEALWHNSRGSQTHQAKRGQILFDTDRITAFAIGNPSDAFGEAYKVFDSERRIARLPGPPFQFLDRIVAVSGEPWKLVEGATVTAEYDVPPDAWYFQQGRQERMPFSVLLEIALQPCGWLAAYLGSALTSPVDLSFRNLDGHAVQHRPVNSESATLSIDVKLTRVASSGGMIIQNYDFEVSDNRGIVYSGDTVFGFFSQESLSQQVGVRGATAYQPDPGELTRSEHFVYPINAPFPDAMMRMIDEVDLYIDDGGASGLGFIRGRKVVDPDEWFFKAHFYQDPVCPGSLGLESFLQLLKVVATRKWRASEAAQFETVTLGTQHRWNYRGQIIPSNKEVVVDATITAIDHKQHVLTADGCLSVDGKIIYQMTDFTLKLIP